MTVEALRRGRPEVLSDLLEAYGSEIGVVAFLILRDRAAAEDVVVETLLTALSHGRDLRDPDALRPWLLRIAANHALSMKRRGARVVQLTLVPEIGGHGGLGGASERAAVRDAIRNLPPRMRAAIVLRYYADLSVEGVAEALDVSPNTIKSQLKTAFDHLRTALADEAPPEAEADHA